MIPRIRSKRWTTLHLVFRNLDRRPLGPPQGVEPGKARDPPSHRQIDWCDGEARAAGKDASERSDASHAVRRQIGRCDDEASLCERGRERAQRSEPRERSGAWGPASERVRASEGRSPSE
jgi:hypothetical protein